MRRQQQKSSAVTGICGHFPWRQEKASSAISTLLKTFAQTEKNSRGEEANEEIHTAVTGISLHMVVMELLQQFKAKEKTNSTVIHSTFSKSNGLNTDLWHEGTSRNCWRNRRQRQRRIFLMPSMTSSNHIPPWGCISTAFDQNPLLPPKINEKQLLKTNVAMEKDQDTGSCPRSH